ncbi:type I-E CRISPR-associated protein Cse2/CasB [Amycolatopsis taiwanensis]|uniref:Type I-E CRISPR-associated protein Cse2/CasB n=1 Tax=Amycolatopsis taiwanensis TaxID=342230 RepID=A0A9W6R713_9PSEU|nr:type I-E CRISPR-associated protein Cse2/CasB [Amycolatopsis taiwanensis]GLY68777.1 type I-E CRISPR-associated protein Cse2/CasB [Amycolatopsis taiwanensis]
MTSTEANTEARPARHFWERVVAEDGKWRATEGGAPTAELAALRRGVNREPGDVAEMWPFYTTLRSDGTLSEALRAEHLALTLFAVHQQSVARPMHAAGIGLGTAIRALRESTKFSPDAVDRRFSAAATATSLNELGMHLRGLIGQLRVMDRPGQPLDYTQLFRDLRDWQRPENQARVRRRWGSQYFVTPKSDTDS